MDVPIVNNELYLKKLQRLIYGDIIRKKHQLSSLTHANARNSRINKRILPHNETDIKFHDIHLTLLGVWLS